MIRAVSCVACRPFGGPGPKPIFGIPFMTESAFIRVMTAEPHDGMRDGIRFLIESSPDMEPAGEAAGGDDILSMALDRRPDILLMDIALPEVNSLDLIRKIHASAPFVRIILLSMYRNRAYVHHALQNGASGYILTPAAMDEITAAVRKVHQGGCHVSRKINMHHLDHPSVNNSVNNKDGP